MNVLLLTGPFFMIQIYDRILPSQSLATLVALSLLVCFLMAAYGSFDYIRSRLVTRIATLIDLQFAGAVFGDGMRAGARSTQGGDPTRDLKVLRQFLTGPSAIGLFDVPWLPVYLGVVFALHPALGWMAVIAAALLIALAVTNAHQSRSPSRETTLHEIREDGIVSACRRNVETIRAMGMHANLQRIWLSEHTRVLAATRNGADRSALFSSLSRAFRLLLQSAVLAVGAWLVIDNALSAGSLIAASITFARALAPLDAAIAQWRSVVTARQSWLRLRDLLAEAPPSAPHVALDKPRRTLSVECVAVAAPNRRNILVDGASFHLQAGDGLGIIGPSGSGKSTLVRGLVGAWPMVRGEVRLDGATPSQWDAQQFGRCIGYLPQEVQLFDGKVSDNISRFNPSGASEAIIAAAKLAGVHECILALPQGYSTVLGSEGVVLSSGQQQRIALARAVYGSPFLIVLDEPNAHLDLEGEQALSRTIQAVRKSGSIVLVVAHRKTAISELNKLLVLEAGKIVHFGDKDGVFAEIAARSKPQDGGLRVVAR